MTDFPTSVPTFATLADLADSVLASHQNLKAVEITAIANHLIEAATEVTVSSGTLTVTKSRHKVQPQSGTSDDIDTISGMPDNSLLVLFASDAGTDTLTLKHGTDNISCAGGTDIEISDGFVLCYYDGTTVFAAGGVAARVVTTIIEGMKMIWNSSTSLSIGVGKCDAENGDLIDVTSTLTAASLSLSASTWYHVYVYLSGGSPAMEVVTTAPTAWKGTAYSKTGDTSRRYMGSVLTDGSGNVKQFVHDLPSSIMHYSNFRADATPHRVLNGGTATTAAAVSLTGIIPVTAILAKIRFVNTADKIVYTGENNSVSSTQSTVGLGLGNTAQQNAFVMHPMDSSQQIWYVYASAVGAGGGYLDVLGYFYER